MNKLPKPLYRKYNKRAIGFHLRQPNCAYRHERNSKEMNNFEGVHKAISNTREGYDYTPLFLFLLSKVGQKWDEVFSEAVSRLDQKGPIFWMVDLNFEDAKTAVVRLGESSYYSKLMVREGMLILASKHAVPPGKSCTCCTHTFNGKVY